MKNIMLDLETMGSSFNSAIVSIGAVEFDQTLGIVDSFHVNIDLQSSIDKGFEIDGRTLYWWLNQSDEARKALQNDKISIKDALQKFKDWINKGNENLQIWGNGADFDNVILQNAFKKFKVYEPWPYWGNRCFRTMRSSFANLEMKQEDKHNALSDAKFQAEYLIALVEKFKLKDVL